MINSKSLRKIWLKIVSVLIWTNERIFFYPKLKKFYKNKFYTDLIIFDIGANSGQSVKFFSSIFNKAKIYAFEASPTTYKFLTKYNSSLIKTFNIGISDKTNRLIFYECVLGEVSSFEKPDISSSYFRMKSKILLTRPENMFNEVNIEVMSLDSFIAKEDLPKIDILKIDVEGHEFKVLLGSENTLRNKKVRYVQLEVHNDNQYENKSLEIDLFLKKLSYKKIFYLKHGFGDFADVIYELCE